MKLREQIQEAVTKQLRSGEDESELIERISNDFTIGFSEWMTSGVEFLDDTEKGRVYLFKRKKYLTKELLEIYKKEKGL